MTDETAPSSKSRTLADNALQVLRNLSNGGEVSQANILTVAESLRVVREETIDEIVALLRRVADASHPEAVEFIVNMHNAADRIASIKSGDSQP